MTCYSVGTSSPDIDGRKLCEWDHFDFLCLHANAGFFSFSPKQVSRARGSAPHWALLPKLLLGSAHPAAAVRGSCTPEPTALLPERSLHTGPWQPAQDLGEAGCISDHLSGVYYNHVCVHHPSSTAFPLDKGAAPQHLGVPGITY